jgi:hypothetical protein
MYDAALIMLGTNDLAQKGVTAQEIAAAITQLHTVCHSFGIQTVALPILPNYFSCTTSRDDLVAYQTTRRQVNRLLEEWTVPTCCPTFSLACRIGTYKDGWTTIHLAAQTAHECAERRRH